MKFIKLLKDLERLDYDEFNTDDNRYKKYYDLIADALCEKLKDIDEYEILKTYASSIIYNKVTGKVCFVFSIDSDIETEVLRMDARFADECQLFTIYGGPNPIPVGYPKDVLTHWDDPNVFISLKSTKEEIYSFIEFAMKRLNLRFYPGSAPNIPSDKKE